MPPPPCLLAASECLTALVAPPPSPRRAVAHAVVAATRGLSPCACIAHFGGCRVIWPKQLRALFTVVRDSWGPGPVARDRSHGSISRDLVIDVTFTRGQLAELAPRKPSRKLTRGLPS